MSKNTHWNPSLVLRNPNWPVIYVFAALFGIGLGYVLTNYMRPNLLPAFLQFGFLSEPTTVLFLGTDVVYSTGSHKKADPNAFTGRSDTIMVARLDPIRNAFSVLSIPRDTQITIPGYGTQKINAANAIGGPLMAKSTISQFLEIPIDHYVVLNVHGLVELIDEMGGITVEVPKTLHYKDWTAKLFIDLTPGPHTLNGNQAMGYVRYRHDQLGDIGRVQRQQMFVQALLDKAKQPGTWMHLPKLVDIAQNYITTDLSPAEIMKYATFVRGVPKDNQFLAMMPGSFSGTGDWLVDRSDVRVMVARMSGTNFVPSTKNGMRVTIENASSYDGLGQKVSRYLRNKGYYIVAVKRADSQRYKVLRRSRIIAQTGNSEDAGRVKVDLGDNGDIVNASLGDIYSSVTVVAGDDLNSLVSGAH